jgi:hypothetical protein
MPRDGKPGKTHNVSQQLARSRRGSYGIDAPYAAAFIGVLIVGDVFWPFFLAR